MPSLGDKLRAVGTIGFFARTARLRAWLAILLEYMTVQAGVQVVAVLTGLAVVRWLGKQDYAYYTIANTWLTALVSLSNSGVANATTALGGRVWDDSSRLGGVLKSALNTRRQLGLLVAVPIAGMLCWTLLQNGAGIAQTAAILVLVGVGSFFQLTSSILMVALRLQGRVRRIQLIEGLCAALRLGATVLVAVIYFDAITALVAITIATVAQYLLTRRWSAETIELNARPDPEATARIYQIVRRQWLNELNGVLQGQISIILLSFFGTAASIADLGALGRIGVLFSIFSATIQAIILPAYARCQEPSRLRQLYIRIVAGYTALAMAPVLITWIMPQPFLWLLGPQYHHLAFELTLVALAIALASINGTTWGLNGSRGWIIPGWWLVPLGLAIQLAIMAAVGVSTVRQVLLIGILSSLVGCVINMIATLVFSRGFTRL